MNCEGYAVGTYAGKKEIAEAGKIEGARQAFEKYFDNIDIEGIAVESNVGAQPVNEEILQGAKNRIKNLKKYANNNNIKADFYIASEAGITNLLGEWIDINAFLVKSILVTSSLVKKLIPPFPFPNSFPLNNLSITFPSSVCFISSIYLSGIGNP